MPEYSLDELKKFDLNEFQQTMLFGQTIVEMQKLNPKGKISTWLDIQSILECNSRLRDKHNKKDNYSDNI